jgi:hypothetical protein
MPGITTRIDSPIESFTMRQSDCQYRTTIQKKKNKTKVFHFSQCFKILPSYEAYMGKKNLVI